MNRLETWTMNNPLRAAMQHWVEASWLRRLGGGLDGGLALELGCGRGEGLGIILKRFGADRVIGIDLDAAQVERAQRRAALRHPGQVEVQQGDASRLEFPDGTFDAVFDFAILHHVPEWRQALREVFRVLKPGGRLYFEEVLRGFLEARAARMLFRHPEQGHFTAQEFNAACADAGLELLRSPTEVGRYFALGVAKRPAATPAAGRTGG